MTKEYDPREFQMGEYDVEIRREQPDPGHQITQITFSVKPFGEILSLGDLTAEQLIDAGTKFIEYGQKMIRERRHL